MNVSPVFEHADKWSESRSSVLRPCTKPGPQSLPATQTVGLIWWPTYKVISYIPVVHKGVPSSEVSDCLPLFTGFLLTLDLHMIVAQSLYVLRRLEAIVKFQGSI